MTDASCVHLFRNVSCQEVQSQQGGLIVFIAGSKCQVVQDEMMPEFGGDAGGLLPAQGFGEALRKRSIHRPSKTWWYLLGCVGRWGRHFWGNEKINTAWR